MISVLRRLLWKEFYDLARRAWVLFGVFLVPLYLLLVSTTFVQDDGPVLVVVLVPEEEPELYSMAEDLARSKGIYPIIVPGTADISAQMARQGARLGIVLSPDFEPVFVERSVTRLERRLNYELVLQLQGELNGVDPRFAAALDSLMEGAGPQINLSHQLVLSGPGGRLFVPRVLSFIAVVMAALLAARSILRELEAETLPLLVTLPKSGSLLVIATKLSFVGAISTVVLAFLMLTMPSVFGFYIKPGLPGIFGAHLLAVIASASVGLGLALFGRSMTQAYLTVSLYLIANLVLTGFLSPLDEAAWPQGTLLRVLFPLTFLRPLFEGWFFFGDPVSWRGTELRALFLHALASLCVLLVIVRNYERRI